MVYHNNNNNNDKARKPRAQFRLNDGSIASGKSGKLMIYEKLPEFLIKCYWEKFQAVDNQFYLGDNIYNTIILSNVAVKGINEMLKSTR